MRKSKPKHLVLLLILLAVIFSGCGGKKEDPAAKYTLVVTVQPQGAGNVMLDPAGGKYLQGTQVLLYPAANSGYEFVGWEGEHSGNVVAAGDHWKIRMDGNRRITARFAELLPNQVAKPEANPSGTGGSRYEDYVKYGHRWCYHLLHYRRSLSRPVPVLFMMMPINRWCRTVV